MHWEAEDDGGVPVENLPVVDLAYAIRCRQLPVDHGYALYEAVRLRLAWWDAEPQASLHTIHAASSGNGWISPEDRDGSTFLPSRRSRLRLRVPVARVGEAERLVGAVLAVAGNELEVGPVQRRHLVAHTALTARHVLCHGSDEPEADFLGRVLGEVRGRGIACKKAVCGRDHGYSVGGERRRARSVMLADLRIEDALALQVEGLREGGKYGCGVFVPCREVRDLFSRAGT